MKRVNISARPDWQSKVEKQGLTWHSENGCISWNESAAYILTRAEVDLLSRTAREISKLVEEACLHVIKNKLWSALGFAERDAAMIISSWDKKEVSLCGRFDFLIDADGIPKLLEFNAETALSLVETAVIQKRWLADVMPNLGQSNDLETALSQAWRYSGFKHVHCAWRPRHEEVEGTIHFMAGVLKAAGIQSTLIPLHRIGWHAKTRQFVDETGEKIDCCYKIYPWNWMLEEPFACHVTESNCHFVEPAWRLMAGNKGVLCILAKLYPDHPATLSCNLNADAFDGTYVSKPIFGHEGQNVRIQTKGRIVESLGGECASQIKVFQDFVDSKRFDKHLPQFGVWVVGGEPAAIGIRETIASIISANSPFVPHAVEIPEIRNGQ